MLRGCAHTRKQAHTTLMQMYTQAHRDMHTHSFSMVMDLHKHKQKEVNKKNLWGHQWKCALLEYHILWETCIIYVFVVSDFLRMWVIAGH